MGMIRIVEQIYALGHNFNYYYDRLGPSRPSTAVQQVPPGSLNHALNPTLYSLTLTLLFYLYSCSLTVQLLLKWYSVLHTVVDSISKVRKSCLDSIIHCTVVQE